MTSEDGTCKHSTHEKALSFAREGYKILGTASLKIITRILAWGALGLFLGIGIWNILYWTGLLGIDWKYWHIFPWVLLPLYLIIGAGLLGYAGLWRGVGRTVLYVGIERGLLIFLVEKIFDRFVILLRHSDKISKTMDESQRFVENLPMQIWEDKLKQAVDAYLAEDDKDVEGTKPNIGQRISRRIRGFLCRKIEYFLLKIVRKEIDEKGAGGGVSVSRVQEVAFEKLEDTFGDFIKGMMKKKLLICLGITILAFSIAPISAYFF